MLIVISVDVNKKAGVITDMMLAYRTDMT